MKVAQTEIEKKQVIVNCLTVGLTVVTAAKAAGVSRNWVYDNMKTDPQFAQDVQQQQALGIKDLVDAAYKRALTGSDKLMIFWLSTHTEEFKNKPTITEADLQVLEKVIGLMTAIHLLPVNTDAMQISASQLN